jgi:hypothetical protein
MAPRLRDRSPRPGSALSFARRHRRLHAAKFSKGLCRCRQSLPRNLSGLRRLGRHFPTMSPAHEFAFGPLTTSVRRRAVLKMRWATADIRFKLILAVRAQPDTKYPCAPPERSNRPLHLLRDLLDGCPGFGMGFEIANVFLRPRFDTAYCFWHGLRDSDGNQPRNAPRETFVQPSRVISLLARRVKKYLATEIAASLSSVEARAKIR